MTTTESLKIIFLGTPDFAASHLQALLDSGHNVIAIFTQPDRQAGRGKKLLPGPVKMLAQKRDIPVFQPVSLRNTENRALIQSLNPDVIIVVAYGMILPREVLDIPRFGCINIHGSLLPRWRGAAPIQRALWAGDTQTGITVIQMDASLDTGEMLYQSVCPITRIDTSASLYPRLAKLGCEGLLCVLEKMVKGTLVACAQEEKTATYAQKLSKEEARLDWSLPAVQLERNIRAFNPWPISYFVVSDQIIRVWQASVLPRQSGRKQGEILQADKNGIQISTAEGVLNIEQLQPAGKKIMSAKEFLNSRRHWFSPGSCLD